MDSDNAGQGTQADRLSQLADLHRQGILSDEDYAAATSRLGGEPREGQSSASATPSSAPVSKQHRSLTSRWVSLIALGIIVLIVGTFLATRGGSSGSGDINLVGSWVAHFEGVNGAPGADLYFTFREDGTFENHLADGTTPDEEPDHYKCNLPDSCLLFFKPSGTGNVWRIEKRGDSLYFTFFLGVENEAEALMARQ